MLVKNKYPILEYDTNKKAVIMPDIEGNFWLPKKAVFAFLSDEVEMYARQNQCKILGIYHGLTKRYPIYLIEHKGQKVCFCQAPVGAPASTMILDFMIERGVKEIVAVGCCGVLTELAENEFLVVTEALRDEGTSYHYLPPERIISLDEKAIKAIQKSLENQNIEYKLCRTWTTDGFFRETADMVKYRKEEGFTAVDMECSALAACARFRGAVFGQILFTADTLADLENYDVRGEGKASFEISLGIAVDAVCEI